MNAPLTFEWTGEAMVPASPHMARLSDREYVIGERYQLARYEDRSGPSHRQFFAAVNDAWETLPDHLAAQFPSAEHLRHHCLIRAGFCDSSRIVAASKAEAMRLAAFIRPMDEYAIVTVDGCVVTRYVARSQSYRAMPKGEFQRSKDAVFDQIALLLGTAQERAA